MLSVLCVQSHDGVRVSVKARFQTLSHEGSMRAVGYRQHQRVFPVFVSCNKDLKDFLPQSGIGDKKEGAFVAKDSLLYRLGLFT